MTTETFSKIGTPDFIMRSSSEVPSIDGFKFIAPSTIVVPKYSISNPDEIITIPKIESAIIYAYTIGYPCEGESIVFLICDSESSTVYFSCVIDAYEDSGINKTIEILRDHKVDKLNVLIWTHTDADHTSGIRSIVELFCDKETVFFVPSGVSISTCPSAKETLDAINYYNQNRIKRVVNVDTPTKTNREIYKRILKEDFSDSTYILKIEAIAPNSSLSRRAGDDINSYAANTHSIAALFTIGNMRFLFTGDIEDQTIREIAEHNFEALYYVNIPHHGSLGSRMLIDEIEKHRIDDMYPFATTTVYTKCHLPNEEVLMKYSQNFTNTYSTGIGSHDCGIICTTHKLTTGEHNGGYISGNAKKVP